MEMCYNDALVMPNNYAVVNEDEMTYVDGGWAIETHLLYSYVYFTHKERVKITDGCIIAGIPAVIGNLISALIAAYGGLLWNHDEGHGVRVKVIGGYIPIGFKSLSKKEEKNKASKNKFI